MLGIILSYSSSDVSLIRRLLAVFLIRWGGAGYLVGAGRKIFFSSFVDGIGWTGFFKRFPLQ